MERSTGRELARRESPYGLAIVPAVEQVAAPHPLTDAMVVRQWQTICEQHGAAILGVRDVPTSPVRVTLDGIEWTIGPLSTAEHVIPADVYHRWRALEAAGVPFMHFLWGEEQAARPRFRPLAVNVGWTTHRDPLVIGVIPTAPGRGVWTLIGRWLH